MLRVAIVGLGPKGLFALERLLDRAAGTPLQVTAFEPHPVPGAGPVYDPGQPSYLRMNNAAAHVDLWAAGNEVVPTTEQRSFVAWDRGRHGGPGAFVPRAVVGRYLADGLAVVLRHADPAHDVRIVASRVRDVVRAGTGARWRVVAGDADHGAFDEVLLATGHVRDARARVARLDELGTPVVRSVFPVDRTLDPAAVPAGAVVGIRGLALTAIDAALALTEGRGGRFVPADGPGRLLWVPGGSDAIEALVPWSRTGLPMAAKPRHDLHADVRGLDVLAADGRDRIRGIAGTSTDAVDALADEVRRVADEALALVVGGGRAVGSGHRLRVPGPTAAYAALSRSLDVAVGAAPPDASWAQGHAWRAVYPAVVDRFGGLALDDAGWTAFRGLAARLERVAFGPSAENVAKVLALADAGVLDLRHVDGGPATDADGRAVVRSAAGARRVDVMVDAVLRPPGVPEADDGPLGRLVARGDLRRLPGRRGVDVDGEARGRDRRADPTPGLSVIGRPTEDAVIGHDTLSRTLHRQADAWARRLAGAADRPRPAVPVGDPA